MSKIIADKQSTGNGGAMSTNSEYDNDELLLPMERRPTTTSSVSSTIRATIKERLRIRTSADTFDKNGNNKPNNLNLTKLDAFENGKCKKYVTNKRGCAGYAQSPTTPTTATTICDRRRSISVPHENGTNKDVNRNNSATEYFMDRKSTSATINSSSTTTTTRRSQQERMCIARERRALVTVVCHPRLQCRKPTLVYNRRAFAHVSHCRTHRLLYYTLQKLCSTHMAITMSML
jgi:hypothetical protein